MEKQESSVKIYFSERYGDFNWMKGNRTLDLKKIKKIKKAIEAGTDFLKYAPIIVNEQMEIIDGQHRYAVCKELKRPVFYVMVNKVDLMQVVSINSNSSNWKIEDFMNTYIGMKKPAYLLIDELRLKYGGTALTLANLLHSGAVRFRSGELFTAGEIEINHPEFTEKLLQQAAQYKNYTINPFKNDFLEALVRLNKAGLFNNNEMLQKLNQTGQQIDKTGNVKSIIQNMEEIMNVNAKKRVIIYQ